MTELEELEDIVGSLKNIKPFGIEADFSSLGLEPAEVLGFKSEYDMEKAMEHLTIEVKPKFQPLIYRFYLQKAFKMIKENSEL